MPGYRRGKRRRLRNDLRRAQTYEEWCRAAEALDRYIGKGSWKESAPYGFYDYRLIQKVIKHLQIYMKDAYNDPDAAQNLKDVLYACLKHNFAGIENRKLYSNTYLGTKRLIEEYVDEGMGDRFAGLLQRQLTLVFYSHASYRSLGTQSTHFIWRQATGVQTLREKLRSHSIVPFRGSRVWIVPPRRRSGTLGQKVVAIHHHWHFSRCAYGCSCLHQDRRRIATSSCAWGSLQDQILPRHLLGSPRTICKDRRLLWQRRMVPYGHVVHARIINLQRSIRTHGPHL